MGVRYVGPNKLPKAANGQIALGWDDKHRPIWGYNKAGRPICNSPKSHTIEDPGYHKEPYCQNEDRKKNGRCIHHGGNQIRGPMHHQYKHGYMSDALGDDFTEKFKEIFDDPHLIDLRVQAVFNLKRQKELLESLADDADEKTWESVNEYASFVEDSMLSPDVQEKFKEEALENKDSEFIKFGNFVEQLIFKIKKGVNRKRTWSEYDKAQESHRRMAESIAKIEQLKMDNMGSDQVMMLFMMVIQIWKRRVQEHILDPEALTELYKDVTADIDRLAIIPNNKKALGMDRSASAIIEPKARVADSIRITKERKEEVYEEEEVD